VAQSEVGVRGAARSGGRSKSLSSGGEIGLSCLQLRASSASSAADSGTVDVLLSVANLEI
jgi:hypothetical protein